MSLFAYWGMKIVTVYSGGNIKGKELFGRLLKMADEKSFDDEYLVTLVEYKELYPESEKFDIFFAWYAVAHGNYLVALESALVAEKKRPLNFEVWKLLKLCYEAIGELDKSAVYEGLCVKFYAVPMRLQLSKDMIEEYFARLRNYVTWQRLWPILLTFIIVSTIAIFALTRIEDHILRRILGVALVLISIYFMLFSQKIKLPTTKRVQVGAGTLSGLMGGFFGMQGPPAVLYFIQSEPTKEHYMAMAQTYFLIGNVMMTGVRAYNGFFTTTVAVDYLYGLGGVIIGTIFGAYVFKHIPNRIFRYIVYAYICISGVIILMTN